LPPAVKVITVTPAPQEVPLASTHGLAFTGADVASLVGIAVLLLLFGAAMIRRNRHSVTDRTES